MGVTCIAHYRFGCCGYVRYRGKVGVTYPDGTKYHCERNLLHPLVEQAEDEHGSCMGSHVLEHGHEPFSLVARSVSGQEYCIPNVTAMLTLSELKQRIAKQVNGALPT